MTQADDERDATAQREALSEAIAEADLLGLTPGAFVRNPRQPDWGLGQVQSSIGRKVTVNFENQGKLVIDAGIIPLTRVED